MTLGRDVWLRAEKKIRKRACPRGARDAAPLPDVSGQTGPPAGPGLRLFQLSPLLWFSLDGVRRQGSPAPPRPGGGARLGMQAPVPTPDFKLRRPDSGPRSTPVRLLAKGEGDRNSSPERSRRLKQKGRADGPSAHAAIIRRVSALRQARKRMNQPPLRAGA